jgi:HPr kinase/phosphorylase
MSPAPMSRVFPPGVGIHATAIVVGEAGILILGPSGSGKSALALALLARARDAGLFAALIGDDRVWLRAVDGRLLAAGAAHMAGLIERRGVGILTVAWQPEAVVRLAIDLSAPGAPWPCARETAAAALLEGVETLRFPLDGRAGEADNADAAMARLRTMTKGSCPGKRILLEQFAAVHKIDNSPAGAQGQGSPKSGD